MAVKNNISYSTQYPTSAPDLAALNEVQHASVISYLLMLFATLFIWPQWLVIAGLTGGALVGYLNFFFLRKLVVRLILAQIKNNDGLKWGGVFFLKIIGLIALSLAIIFGLKVDTVAFMAGFSCIFCGVVYYGVKSVFNTSESSLHL